MGPRSFWFCDCFHHPLGRRRRNEDCFLHYPLTSSSAGFPGCCGRSTLTFGMREWGFCSRQRLGTRRSELQRAPRLIVLTNLNTDTSALFGSPFKEAGWRAHAPALPGTLAFTPQGNALPLVPHSPARVFRGTTEKQGCGHPWPPSGRGKGWCLHNESRAPVPKAGRRLIADNLLPECWSPSYDSEGTEALVGRAGISLGLQTRRAPLQGLSAVLFCPGEHRGTSSSPASVPARIIASLLGRVRRGSRPVSARTAPSSLAPENRGRFQSPRGPPRRPRPCPGR